LFVFPLHISIHAVSGRFFCFDSIRFPLPPYCKKELRGIDRRIHYLQKRMPSLNIVARPPDDQDRIFFSAWVTLENEQGEEITYRIVGADELDPKKNYISLDSPLAKVLLKKTFDDEVVVSNDVQATRYVVVDIRYES